MLSHLCILQLAGGLSQRGGRRHLLLLQLLLQVPFLCLYLLQLLLCSEKSTPSSQQTGPSIYMLNINRRGTAALATIK
jgi:hypothetical protein